MLIVAAAGVLLIAFALLDAFETIVLPRRVSSRLRITPLFYAAFTFAVGRQAVGELQRDATDSWESPASDFSTPAPLLGRNSPFARA